MRAHHSSSAQGSFSGVRTILVPPDIVAVPRRSPAPVRKRTPWHPQPDGQARTERSGAREWFSDKLFADGRRDHARRAFSASIGAHVCGAIAIGAVVLAQTVPVPIVRAGTSLVMPASLLVTPTISVPPPRSPARPASPAKAQPPPSQPSARQAAAVDTAAPIDAPSGIAPETGAESGVLGGVSGDVLVGSLGSLPAPSGAGTSGQDGHGPYHVGGGSGIRPPRKIRDVKPAYPLSALTGRTHGNVIIEATIGVDGKVERAIVVHSVPLLDEAALDAVRQWEYAPSVLDGVAVAVIVMVVVNFTIQ